MELTRREALAALGTAAASLAFGSGGCTTKKRAITGKIVGGSDARGHRIRDGISQLASPVPSAEIVILGGGVAGLSAAWKLLKSNRHDFVLLELEDSLGGTAVSGSNAICEYPWGAHYIPVPTREQRTLCELLLEMNIIKNFDAAGRAVPAEQHLCRAPEERLFYRGEWSEGLYLRAGASADDLQQFERFESNVRLLAKRTGNDGKRAFTIPIANCSVDPELRSLDRLSMAQWLESNNYNSPRLKWYIEYACRDDFGSLLGATSAWAALHYFCSRVSDGEYDAAEFLTWPEGNGFIIKYLNKLVGSRSRPGCAVYQIENVQDSVKVKYFDFRDETAKEIITKRVICALPSFAVRRLFAPAAADRAHFNYAPWAVANLSLDSEPESRGFPICWDNVLYESESLGYVVATHQLDRLAKDSVWTWYRPYCEQNASTVRAQMLTFDFEHYKNAVITDLVRAHPRLDRHITNIDVWRWGHAMIRPEPEFLFHRTRERAAKPIGNIHFAAADLGGLPLFEEAQWAGVRAAEEVLQAFGAAFSSSL
ncbi:MAG: FAD-dependent oxidoreductase [Planctomycetota bacterium]